MKKQLMFFAFALLSTMYYSQSVPSTPQIFEDFKTNDGTQNFFYKNLVKTDASGNIYTLGATTTSNSTTDILLSKKTSAGVTVWTKQINGSANYHDFGAGMVITSGGDVYITGAITNNTTTLAPDLIIRKYNSSGTQQFSTTYSGAGYGAVGKDIIIDGSSNTYIAGAEYNSSLVADMLIISFNSSGSQRWVTNYDYNGLNDGAVKLATKGSNVSITGAITVSSNNYKIATLSCPASTGVLSETITLGSTMTSSVEIVTDMFVDASNNTYICGATEVSGQGFNMYLAKLTSSLTIAWEQTYDGASHLNDQAKSIKVDGSGNVYVTGYSTSANGKDIRTIKYNSSGTLQWNVVENSSINGNDEAFDMEIDASSNLYVVGSMASANLDLLNYYTVKYNSSGTKIFEIQTDGKHLNDQATNVALDSLNNVIVTGESETSPGNYVYTTCKYVQKDVITPTDLSAETPKESGMFYPNKGQLLKSNDSLVTDIKFYTHQTYPVVFMKDHSQSYVFSRIDTVLANNDTLHRIDLTFNSVVESAKTYPLEEQSNGILNFYLAHTGSEGIKGVRGNKRLITTNLYSNIDLMTTSNQDGIKYYFIVKPGADMRDIKLEFTGATSYSLNGTTNVLSLNTPIGTLNFDKPRAYQLTSANATVAVTSFSPTWTTNGASNKYKFNDGAYTASLTLVIEVKQKVGSVTAGSPPEWGTFYGSNVGAASSSDITTDQNGNLYTTGYMSTSNFPVSTGGSYPSYVSGIEAYTTKFNSDYARMFTTIYGGTSDDKGNGITCDKLNGKIYICGSSSNTNAPVMALSGSATSFTNNAAGGSKCFVNRMDTLYGYLEWATKFGASNTAGKRIKADANGNIYMVGDLDAGCTFTVTCSANSSNGFPLCYAGSGSFAQWNRTTWHHGSFATESWIARFNSQTGLTWTTMFSGNGDEFVKGLAIDDVNHKMYICGYTESLWTGVANCTGTVNTLPLCNSSGNNFWQNRLNGNGTYSYPDGFIARFDMPTTSLEWGTYIGGSNDDIASDIITDNSGNVFVTGYTKSSVISNTNCAVPTNNALATCSSSLTFTQPPSGGYDAYIAKFSQTGTQLWGTYDGGYNDEQVGSPNELCTPKLAHNEINDNIYMGLTTRSCANSFGTYNNMVGSYYQSAHGDSICTVSPTDGYIHTFNNNGGQEHSTFFGGRGSLASSTYGYLGDLIGGLATYKHRIYVSGVTYSNSRFPFHNPGTTNAYYNTTYGSAQTNHVFYAQLNSTAVGIHELESKKHNSFSLNVFPNPTNGKISFEWNNTTSKKAQITIYNLMGQMVTSLTINEATGSNKQEINVSDLTFGLYLVVIKTEVQTLNAKFIKE